MAGTLREDREHWQCRNCQKDNRSSGKVCVCCGRNKYPPIHVEREPIVFPTTDGLTLEYAA